MDLAVHNQLATAYASANAELGVQHFIANLDTTVTTTRWGMHIVPMTVNEGFAGTTFVCSPRVTYVDYLKEELQHFPNRAVRPALNAIVSLVGLVLRPANANRIVHVNNWMMSTNLPIELDPGLVKTKTNELTALHFDKVIAIRSLTERHSSSIIAALRSGGWMMIPARQVFLVDDAAYQLQRRRDSKRDDRIYRSTALRYEELDSMTSVDAERIAALYALLYLRKYSRLNPAYTPAFIRMTHKIGLIRYLVLRDKNGVIQGFGGMKVFAPYATMPLIGYNTALPQELGIYRMVFHAGSLFAARRDLIYNMSSGAGGYKLNRGATPEIEFTAYFVRHLPRVRQIPFAGLQAIGRSIGAPLLKRYSL